MLETEYTFLFFFFFLTLAIRLHYTYYTRDPICPEQRTIFINSIYPKSTLLRNEIFLHAWLNELVSPSSPIPPSLVSTLNHSRDLINEPYYRYFCTRSSLSFGSLKRDPFTNTVERYTRSEFFETRDNRSRGNGYGIGVKWIFRVRFE